jgi:hypothetical protein
MTDNKLSLTLALALISFALLVAAISTPPAIGKADSIIPMNHWHVPAEASACGVA